MECYCKRIGSFGEGRLFVGLWGWLFGEVDVVMRWGGGELVSW
jgi:hypothetical protein